jgi:hypothetical protein
MKQYKPYTYKGYLVLLEQQANGSVLAVATDIDDARARIKKVYDGYQVSYIKAEMKLWINDAVKKTDALISIDCSKCVAKDGDEDSFSNLGV